MKMVHCQGKGNGTSLQAKIEVMTIPSWLWLDMPMHFNSLLVEAVQEWQVHGGRPIIWMDEEDGVEGDEKEIVNG